MPSAEPKQEELQAVFRQRLDQQRLDPHADIGR
jgi:hypothetical protein